MKFWRRLPCLRRAGAAGNFGGRVAAWFRVRGCGDAAVHACWHARASPPPPPPKRLIESPRQSDSKKIVPGLGHDYHMAN